MIIRRTKTEDIDAVAAIYEQARSFMREQGNPTQWQSSRPSREDILADIDSGRGYVVVDNEEIVGAFYFYIGNDPTYEHIYKGSWENEDKYAVIHRIAVKYYGRGIARFVFDECFSRFGNLKIDTHKDNIPMQRSLLKNGFHYCGIIYITDGTERLAYQRTE